MRETTFLLILDACRRDYVTPENAPFLHGLMQKGLTASIESPPGFTQRTTMFTGTYPATSNAFSAFGYDPENSPFRWVGRLGPLAQPAKKRRLGLLDGKFTIPEDFNDPLPDGVIAAFEGRRR